MGLFNWNKKKGNSPKVDPAGYDKQAFEEAYAELDDHLLKNFFPGGKDHLKNVVESFRFLLNKDIDPATASELYRTIGSRVLLFNFDNKRIGQTLKARYADIVDENKYEPLLAFVRTSLNNPSATLVHPDGEKVSPPLSGNDTASRDGSHGEYQFENMEEFFAYIAANKEAGRKEEVIWSAAEDYAKAFEEGFALVDEGKHKQAIPVYLKCLRYNPVAYQARLELATCYSMTGEYARGEEQLKELAKYKMPDTIMASYYRRYGYLLAEEGRNAASYACYKYSLEIEPGNKNAENELEYLNHITREDLSKYNPITVMQREGIPVLERLSSGKD